MGCLLCNITSCKEFVQAKGHPKKNFFFCNTEEERNEFINELVSDIVDSHPEVASKILAQLHKGGLSVENTIIEGHIVHFVLDSGPSKGEHRPAIIVRVWNQEPGTCNLNVFTDGLNDGITPEDMLWKTSVKPDEDTKVPGTWHWVEREPEAPKAVTEAPTED